MMYFCEPVNIQYYIPIKYQLKIFRLKEYLFQGHGNPSVDQYIKKSSPSHIWKSQFSNRSSDQLFDDATFRIEELVESLRIRTFFADQNESSSFMEKVSNENERFREQRHRNFGKCYSYSPSDKTRKRGIYYMRFKV